MRRRECRAPFTKPPRRARIPLEIRDRVGVGAGVLSLETGIRMPQDAGYPIEDAHEEVARVTARRQVPAERKPETVSTSAS
ncbi:hypothetical protein [Streptomyces natalensis]|uniref:hypothetical protein n=1 Tax=Streptomyces natalensis TaxID=68242 RepID=UPI000AE12E0E|nr:hypothetical protein [Streptomyces natalensis]